MNEPRISQGDAPIAALNGTEFNGHLITVNEALSHDERRWDSFDEVMDRHDYNRPQDVIPDLQRLAEGGTWRQRLNLPGILYRPGQHHDPEAAYK